LCTLPFTVTSNIVSKDGMGKRAHLRQNPLCTLNKR
jgi:hypothetical protein